MEHSDILYDVFEILDFRSKLSFKLICRAANENHHIKILYNLDKKYYRQINNDNLRKIFYRATVLDAIYGITDVSFMRNLKILYAYHDSNITQTAIQNLNLTELYAGNNEKIYDASFMQTLKVLDASGISGICQKGITGLNLERLNVSSNGKIHDVSFMSNLRQLKAVYYCGIDQTGIAGLNLIYLDASGNCKIHDVSFMKNLKFLYAVGNCGIDQNGIRSLDLIDLETVNNPKIFDVSFMKNLNIFISECTNEIRKNDWLSNFDRFYNYIMR